MNSKLLSINELYPESKQPYKRTLNIPKLNPSSSNQEKREALIEVLKQLSGLSLESYLSEEEEASVISFFSSLYDGESGYRHMYSDVCEVMYEYLKKDENRLDDGVPYEARQLANNMEMIQRKISKDYLGERCADCVFKLYDHIELENTRLRYMARQNSVQIKNVEQINADIESFQEKLQNTQEKLQRNYVTILGIFAAIVITFTAATTFTSSVLQTMESVSIYRLTFVIDILAMILFDAAFTLYYFICRVSGIKEGKYLPWFVIIFNIILLAALVLIFFAWRYQVLSIS